MGYVMKTFDSRFGRHHQRRDLTPFDVNDDVAGKPAASGYYRVRTQDSEREAVADVSRSLAAPARVTRDESTRLGDRVDAWLPVLLFVPPAIHWYVGTELELALLVLSPLLFIMLKRGAAAGAVYAGLCSLLISAVDLAHPLRPGNAVAGGVPHALLSLAVMALVVLRLRDAYCGLKRISQHDPLTGLLNRRGFEESAERELGRAARYHRPIAFAVVDIDRFKEVNDRFGHAQGDTVLRIVGAELARLRASDLAVRLGGDEFGLLMPETDESAAARVVSRLKQRVHERLRTHGWSITISVGTANSEGGVNALTKLMEEADRRMYLEKPRGRELHSQAWHRYDTPPT
jgi:diguanylate cyclase (GGDEF)-like protein